MLSVSTFHSPGRFSSNWRRGVNASSKSSSVSFNWNSSAYWARSNDGLARSSFVGQLSTTVRSKSADAKSSMDCVASSIAPFRFRHVLSASCTYARSRSCCMNRQASSITHSVSCPASAEAVTTVADAVEHVEQQRLQHHRVRACTLEIKDLNALDRQGVFEVIEQIGIASAFDPFAQARGQRARQQVGQRKQATLCGVKDVDVLDGLIQLAVLRVTE